MEQGREDDFLNILLGEKLSSVTFVMDYLQLDFDGNSLTCYIWPTVSIDTRMYSFGDASYRDKLCELISTTVSKIDFKEKEIFTIDFESGNSLALSLDPNNPEIVAEIGIFTDVDGNWAVFD